MKKLLIILLTTAGALVADARTALDFFTSAPDNEIPLLRHSKRLDMVDYYNNGLANTVANELGGAARITEVSERRLTAQLSPESSMELDVLTSGRDTVLAIVTTVLLPMADSQITFYDTDWKPLRRQPQMPGIADFAGNGAQAAEVSAAVPMFFVRATYRPDDDVFVFTSTTAAYFADSERPAALLALPATIERRFKNGRWSRK